MPDLEKFRRDLTDLINACSLENLSNTPDYMLADYLVDCLYAHNAAVRNRDAWYGYKTTGSCFSMQCGDYILQVRRDGESDFTVDLDPHTTAELGMDPQP